MLHEASHHRGRVHNGEVCVAALGPQLASIMVIALDIQKHQGSNPLCLGLAALFSAIVCTPPKCPSILLELGLRCDLMASLNNPKWVLFTSKILVASNLCHHTTDRL